MIIKEVVASKALDSRNQYTIEVTVNGCSASAPSGKSTGKYETKPYRKNLSWNIQAINHLYNLHNLEIKSFQDLKKIEDLICKKYNLKDVKEFGANALFALESAVLKALAQEVKKELWEVINQEALKLPIPVGNAIGGGMHSHNENHPTFQEFLLIPKQDSFRGSFIALKEVYNALGLILNSESTNDEGAWQTQYTDEHILEILSKFHKSVNIGVDIAASSIYYRGHYHYNKLKFNRDKQIRYINHLIDQYNLFYVEDPIQEEDFKGFSKIKSKHLIVGDDLTATHKERLLHAIKNKSINALIIKPNQNGSLLEVAEIFKICRKNKIKTILSHRSGETLDDSLADYAFAFQADYIKCGIFSVWREVKLSRLLEIESSLLSL